MENSKKNNCAFQSIIQYIALTLLIAAMILIVGLTNSINDLKNEIPSPSRSTFSVDDLYHRLDDIESKIDQISRDITDLEMQISDVESEISSLRIWIR